MKTTIKIMNQIWTAICGVLIVLLACPETGWDGAVKVQVDNKEA